MPTKIGIVDKKPEFLEFFAGGGLARIGLGKNWECTFANDFSPKKAAAYRDNFNGASELYVEDVWNIDPAMIPGNPVLAWASFPCQDLSLAGNGKGLDAERSGSFWGFWRIIQELRRNNRHIPIIVLENVVGLLDSKQGKDFARICQSLANGGYFFGAMVVDAIRFVPQSRPRLFIIAISKTAKLDKNLHSKMPERPWHTDKIFSAYENLKSNLKEQWVWWSLPSPPQRKTILADIIEEEPYLVSWHSHTETEKILGQMSFLNLEKVKEAQFAGTKQTGTVYRRTRAEDGIRLQRTEVRFDGISGCLRTPIGGSSRQIVIVVDRKTIKTRLLSPREAARLMGVSDDYKLPNHYNDAYHIMGDAVAVPVVSWLEKYLLRPLAIQQIQSLTEVQNA
ncbi:MAG TPA: DNA (cytosine-5-)-methyltransferase [Fibrobacteres bacterium]|nr:DNA (cytosine-5-)-methyltransferase [Fibrobacterota bacterium]